MAFEIDDDDKARRRRSGSGMESETQDQSNRPRRKPAASPGVGTALREAYQQALKEEVPPEMLDLLGKLG